MTALTVCFPLDVVRTRLMAPTGMPRPPGGVAGAFREIVAAEGLAGLYTGMLPALISIAPSGAVFYGTYDLLRVSAALLRCPPAAVSSLRVNGECKSARFLRCALTRQSLALFSHACCINIF